MQDRLERMCVVEIRNTTRNSVTTFSFWVDIKTWFFKKNKAGVLFEKLSVENLRDMDMHKAQSCGETMYT